MIEQKQGHHHKQTGSLPMKRGDGVSVTRQGVNTEQLPSLIWTSTEDEGTGVCGSWSRLSFTQNMAVKLKRDDVIEQGLHFPSETLSEL